MIAVRGFGFRGPLGGGMWGSGGRVKPLRLVSTRTAVPSASAGGVLSMMSRAGSFARDDLTSIKLAWANWLADGTMSGVAGNVMSIAASIEYPAGVFTQIKFGGSATGSVGPLATLWSDDTPVSIPRNALYWIRTWQTATVGILFSSVTADAAIGEASTFPGTNLTMGGVVPALANQICGPCAIVGRSLLPAGLVIGDSRQVGVGDSGQSAVGAFGEMGSGLNAYAWSSISQAGQTIAGYLSHAGALQADLVQYATDVVCALGINDLNTISAAQLQTAQGTLRALYPGQKFHVTTLDPSATSTNNFIDLPAQTPAASNAQRVIYNTAVRANSLGFDPSFDCAAVSESSLNSGKWKVDGTANKYTVDGLHQSTFCYALYTAAGFTI